jgi:hypothetical protein
MNKSIRIPATSPDRYLGGMAALNLPSHRGTGDWHMEQTFFRQRETRSRSFISGKGCLTNTTDLLGQEGIYDCSKLLDELQIAHEEGPAYAATHARAIADLVLSAVLMDKALDHLQLDAWMPRQTDKLEVFELLNKAVVQMKPTEEAKIRAWMLDQDRSTS